MIEKLQWHDTCKELPDAGSTVLLWVRDPKPFANPGWMTGYLDEGGWHDSETSHALTEIVTHWADPNGPVHNAKSEPTAPLLAQVGSTDGLGVAVPPAPTIDEEIGNG